MKPKTFVISLFVLASIAYSSKMAAKETPTNLKKAEQTLDSIYKYYVEPNTPLLYENYPSGENLKISELWPLSGVFSGVNALSRTKEKDLYLTFLKQHIMPALNAYYDNRRHPACYASRVCKLEQGDRYYDDNLWLGIDFVELYQQTKDAQYLDKAKEIWRFIESGIDQKLGGGVYWCEQKKDTKNTCSNAPAAVLALKLYEATNQKSYFNQGLSIYNWTKKNLQDKSDHLYYDNIMMDHKIEKTKYTYNSGQMLQASALLFKLTKDKKYLTEAQTIAASCINYFTDGVNQNGQSFRLFKPGNIWFTAILFRGFVELYEQDKDKKYIELFDQNLNYAWTHAQDKQGLFPEDWTGADQGKVKWLLNQGAMVEMYASLSTILNN